MEAQDDNATSLAHVDINPDSNYYNTRKLYKIIEYMTAEEVRDRRKTSGTPAIHHILSIMHIHFRSLGNKLTEIHSLLNQCNVDVLACSD